MNLVTWEKTQGCSLQTENAKIKKLGLDVGYVYQDGSLLWIAVSICEDGEFDTSHRSKKLAKEFIEREATEQEDIFDLNTATLTKVEPPNHIPIFLKED